MLKTIVFLFLALLSGCSGPYMGKDLFGADEFVLDSYKIREGKLSILEMEGMAVSELDESLLNEYKDTIHEDDVLVVLVLNHKRPDVVEAVQRVASTVGFRVSNGQLSLPDLSPIPVEGLTLEEARKTIAEQYNRQLQDTEVFVGYKERILRKVELAGLVSMPNVPVDGKLRLFDLLAKARIPTDANLFKSYVIRDNALLPVDMVKLLKEGDMQQNIVMRGGDKVYIAEPGASSLMVMGEVLRERVVNLPAGSISLRHALAEAGGIPFTGDKSYIQVIRGNISKPKIYTLSWEHVIHLPNESLLLMPGDIVYIAAKPITEWNRFISQILPSFGGLEVVKNSGMGIMLP